MLKEITRRALLGLGLTLGLVFAGAPAKAVPVGLELLLLTDVSGSVSLRDYADQKAAHGNLFFDSAIQAAIAAIPGGIAVAYAEWSGPNQQSLQVDWMHVTDAASAELFGRRIFSLGRAFNGATAPGDAIRWGADQLNNNGFEGTRLTIDLVGDGREARAPGGPTPLDTATEAAAAHSQGITINGLAVLHRDPGLRQWYQDNIVTPGGGFLESTFSYSIILDPLRTKVSRELANSVPVLVPEPATLALFGIGLLGLGALRRRRAA